MDNTTKMVQKLGILPPKFGSNCSSKPKSSNKSKIFIKIRKENKKVVKRQCKYNITRKKYDTHLFYITHI